MKGAKILFLEHSQKVVWGRNPIEKGEKSEDCSPYRQIWRHQEEVGGLLSICTPQKG
jgi:hypothetical protein